MIKDKFINSYIGAVKRAIEERRDALVDGIHKDLYSVGKIQGEIRGLEDSLLILENSLNETNV